MGKGISKPVEAHELEPVSLSVLIHQHVRVAIVEAGPVTSYTYDAAGNRQTKTDQPSQVTSNYGYDAIYQLQQVTQGATTTESYSYNKVGNRLSSLGVSPYVYNASNELTSKPGTTADVSQRQNAFSTSRKSPSVRSVIGRVRMSRTGRTKALMRPRSTAAASAGTIPSTAMPGTMDAASMIASALTTTRSRNPICASVR